MATNTFVGLRTAPWLIACGLALSLTNCAQDDSTTAIDVANLLERTIGAGESLALVANVDAETPVVVTVDCGVPTNVDVTGSLISPSRWARYAVIIRTTSSVSSSPRRRRVVTTSPRTVDARDWLPDLPT